MARLTRTNAPTDLQTIYNRNADATGHDADCRRRVVPSITSDWRAFDPERCKRCAHLVRPRIKRS